MSGVSSKPTAKRSPRDASLTRNCFILRQHARAGFDALPQAGATDLNRALYDLGRVITGPGLAIVISDFLSPSGYQTGLRSLARLRQEVALVQVLAPDEIEPDLQGDWQLRDSEGSGSIDVSITPAVLEAYRRRLEMYMQELASFAHDHAMTYAMVPGGYNNYAGGLASFAAGYRAVTGYNGSFVWSDYSAEQDFAV